MIVLIVLATLNLILGITVLMGKCDNLIQGCFSVTTNNGDDKFNIRRIRILMGVFLIILTPLFFLLTIEGTKWPGHLFSAAVWTMLVTYYILVYTWAKK